ncbi:MAG: GNAT family N-acetyltransferase [Halobacteriales archaeon]|nr:GNAT family N-acetyltransferase [Halobacteriales archaeon]
MRWAVRGESVKVYPLVRALAKGEGWEPPRPSAFSRMWAWGFRDAPPFRYAVADDGARIVGCMSLHHHVSTWRAQPAVGLEDFYVLPDLRGEGIGAEMLRFADQHARSLGAARLELHVLEGNEGGKRLYERDGWHRTPYLWYHKDLPAGTKPVTLPRAEARAKKGQGARQRAKGKGRPQRGDRGPPR